MSNKPILLSGVKPTGAPHIGNYFGALRQFVALQDKYQCFVMIADYHALINVTDPAILRRDTLEMALDYLAIGLDPSKVTIFKQSDVSAHTELAWIFNCLVTMPYLQRAHAYKDAVQKEKEINMGLFDYPILMSADILLYDTAVVPVGQDQKQHLEIARDVALKFNHLYGETFKLPEPLILDEVKTVVGLDGQKMSKSYRNTIPLFASDDEIEKCVMAIVTNSSEGIPENVYAIHKLFRAESELAQLYEAKKGKYKDLKEELIKDLKAFVAPMRAKREMIAQDKMSITKILNTGAERARAHASAKMKEVRKKIGVAF